MFETDLCNIVYDEEFKISKQYNPDLALSIKRNGLANPLILIETDSSFRILSGHNRFKALCENSADKICAVKSDDISGDFRKEIIKKNYSGLLSFYGKIKACKYFNTDAALMNELGISSSRRSSNDISLPDALLNYLNEKDAPLKILDELTLMNIDIIQLYETFIKDKGFKFALFRESLSLVSDIIKINSREAIAEIFQKASDDSSLIQELKKLRYPLLSSMFEKSAFISERFKNAGLNLTFPQNFDGGFADISIRIKKKTKASDFFGACGRLTDSDIDDIIDIL
ncbi:MAG: ParB N-terminal domain-containing protein [Spirochaetes bacterium]|nr:ParB N-terminal domain-containing protein [Spirochaetota bacterium]